MGALHILPCLPDFLAAHPKVELTIDLSDQYVDMLDGRYDIAIRIGTRIGPGLSGHRLLAAEGQLPWQLSGPDGTVLHSGKSYVHTNSSEVVRELAIGGCGIALRSLWDVADQLGKGTLRRVLPQYHGSQDVGIFAVHASAPVIPTHLQALVDHLAAHSSGSYSTDRNGS